MSTRSNNPVLLIARREISTRARTRSYLVTTVLLLVVIVVGIIVWSAFAGGSDKPATIGTVNASTGLSEQITQTAQATGTSVRLRAVDSADAARSDVAAGRLDIALVSSTDNGKQTYTAISKSTPDASLEGVLRSATAQYGLSTALAARGVDLDEVTTASTFTTVATTPDRPDEGQRIAIALVGMSLLMFTVLTSGMMVAGGVVEEKTSRVVEILLSTTRPLQLMWGKILGIGAIAFAQVVVLGAAALITATATGLVSIPTTALWTYLATLAWFILGFGFFASLYAATGAMVSRQEDLGSTATPLTFLVMAVMYVGYFGVASLDSTFMRVISWIPPFSASTMPIRIATGHTTAVQVIVTFVSMALLCAVAVWIAARIYQRSILRTGSKVKWSEALGMVRAGAAD
ncbi:ABC transporter permease [Gordonia jinhuaensis]|uniref:ABC transporter permease n=1 Tax=Gordonia jinhuaensis TaxID=1517702 RepID=A0A916T3Q0_9ACTN|nr:ABC transporter permease [Gordonia jinhuaensis]GGB29218.1 ABC transporter permease [Gordonia jinhuaensis]